MSRTTSTGAWYHRRYHRARVSVASREMGSFPPSAWLSIVAVRRRPVDRRRWFVRFDLVLGSLDARAVLAGVQGSREARRLRRPGHSLRAAWYASSPQPEAQRKVLRVPECLLDRKSPRVELHDFGRLGLGERRGEIPRQLLYPLRFSRGRPRQLGPWWSVRAHQAVPCCARSEVPSRQREATRRCARPEVSAKSDDQVPAECREHRVELLLAEPTPRRAATVCKDSMHFRSRVARVVRLLLVPIASVSVTGCASAIVGDAAVQRATREFSCPADSIGVLNRADIYEGLVDVEACGHRARYMCIWGQVIWQCVREPDPARWDSSPSLCSQHDGLNPKPAGCLRPSGEESRNQ